MKEKIKDKDFLDDGRVVADMSSVYKPTPLGTIFGRRFDERPGIKRVKEERIERLRPEETKLDKEDTRLMFFTALKASLFLGLIYIAGIGAVIALLVFIFNH